MDKQKQELIEKIKSGSVNIDDYIELADMYWNEGECNSLFELYGELKKRNLSNNENAFVYHKEGHSLMDCNRTEEAKMAYSASLEMLKNCADSYDCINLKALNHYYLFLLTDATNERQEHAKESLINLDLATLHDDHQNDKKQHLVYSYMADIYLRLGNYEKAISLYNTALDCAATGRDKVWVLSAIASIYGRTNEYDKAMSYFTMALQEADERDATSKIYFDMGIASFDNKRYRDAAESLEEALKTKNSSPSLKNNPEYEIDILWHLGTIAYRIDDEKRLETRFARLFSMMDENHRYYANANITLGHHYLRKGKFEKAREYYNCVLTSPSASLEEIDMARECLKQLPLNA